MSVDKAARPQLRVPRTFVFGAFVSACAFARGTEVAAFALGDGTLRVVPPGASEPRPLDPIHRGAILSLVPDSKGAFVTGGDDGRVVRTAADGSVTELAKFQGRLLDALAAHPTNGAVAVAVGKDVHVLHQDAGVKLGPHPSTVADITFSPDGSRLACAHYNGVTIWNLTKPKDPPRKLAWKGSHLKVSYMPNGRFLASGMQEGQIHCWRLADGSDMQMSGYPAKPKSIAWTADSLMMAGSGAPGFVLWSFAGKGPEGKPPTEFSSKDEPGLTTIVAAHPSSPLIAAGGEDGSVEIGDTQQVKVLPLSAGFQAPVSTLAWSSTGFDLAAGSEDGRAAIFDLRLA
jgi:WD40 repeat protein